MKSFSNWDSHGLSLLCVTFPSLAFSKISSRAFFSRWEVHSGCHVNAIEFVSSICLDKSFSPSAIDRPFRPYWLIFRSVQPVWKKRVFTTLSREATFSSLLILLNVACRWLLSAAACMLPFFVHCFARLFLNVQVWSASHSVNARVTRYHAFSNPPTAVVAHTCRAALNRLMQIAMRYAHCRSLEISRLFKIRTF